MASGKKHRKGGRALAGAVGTLLLAIVAVVGGDWLLTNRIGAFRSDADIYVSPGDKPSDVVRKLDSAAGVRYPSRLERTFEKGRVAEYMKPGHYRIEKDFACRYVARMPNNGWQAPVKVTLSGNLRSVGDIAGKLSRQLSLDSLEIASAMTDAQLLRRLGFTPESAFALFIPDTYEMYWNISAEDLMLRMKKAYDAFWTPVRDAQAKALGLNRTKVAILASIVNCESNYVPDYPQLAGVYVNRLRKGMPLQACPTVQFCFDFKISRILYEHLQVDSPYNTYTHYGLPPGPICSPTREALDGVLNADTQSGYLYFCASSEFNGRHKFSKTFREHEAYARDYQSELDLRVREKRNSQKK
ncbi:MAG: endolytic transglycosylase MltG [Bacteroidales bacterium]|nr:endolytic transglycosylase MltG [Candidatus Cryptobacteroides aphodequi]